MGLLQLLREETYAQLIEESVPLCRGQGELLIGVGDAGFARTADRIRYTNRFAIDGVVVVTPYLVRFQREELKDYFLGLADVVEGARCFSTTCRRSPACGSRRISCSNSPNIRTSRASSARAVSKMRSI